LVTPDVVLELRDKNGRNVLDEARLQLPADYHQEEDKEEEGVEMRRKIDGFQVREPSAEAIAKSKSSLFNLSSTKIGELTRESESLVTAFARKTGDIAVLSATDIRVLALCLTLELEENGTWRVRDHPGQVLIPPPKDNGSKKSESVAGDSTAGDVNEKEEGKVDKVGDVNEVADKLEELEVKEAIPEKVQESTTSSTDSTPPVASTSSAPSSSLEPSTSTLPPPTSTSEEPTASTSSQIDEILPSSSSSPTDEPVEAEDDPSDSESDTESTSSSGSWITPANIHSHKVKDLGLFAAPSSSKSSTPKPKTILKAAVLTGDFAMQNVGLQMGLNVLGSGGKRVKEVRTWVLRCHACFK